MGRVIGALLLTVLLLTGCAREEPLSGSQPEPSAQSSSQPGPAAEEPSSQPESQPESQSEASSDTETAEVDLTGMSSTMVFAEVYNMMVEPESYEGKTVRMQGELVSYPHPFTGEDCHAVIVKDALACCAQGFQFQPAEGVTLPADGAEVTVTGVYTLDESLMDQGIMMSYLAECAVE